MGKVADGPLASHERNNELVDSGAYGDQARGKGTPFPIVLLGKLIRYADRDEKGEINVESNNND